MSAASMKLSNLTAIVDFNGFKAMALLLKSFLKLTWLIDGMHLVGTH